MKVLIRTSPRLWLIPALLCMILPVNGVAWASDASSALQQREVPSPPPSGIAVLIILLLCVAFYAYFAICLQTIANKTSTENAWWGWVPILNILLMLNIAQKPLWWILLVLIPFVNIVITILVWMAIAEARSKPNWWGILMILPLLNVVVPGYLAFSD